MNKKNGCYGMSPEDCPTCKELCVIKTDNEEWKCQEVGDFKNTPAEIPSCKDMKDWETQKMYVEIDGGNRIINIYVPEPPFE